MCSVEEVKRILCADTDERRRFKAERLLLITEIGRSLKEQAEEEARYVEPKEDDDFFDYEKEFD